MKRSRAAAPAPPPADLEPTDQRSVDAAYLDEVFLDGGLLARAKPGYVLRPQQLRLAEAVDRCFSLVPRKALLAEAPTGVGKSFAYLVPATKHAAELGRKVVVVTANIALQEQLCSKDLPFLSEHLPWEFTYELAKGWSNYLCLEALHTERLSQLKGRTLPVLQDQQQFEQASAWADQTQDGDLSELPFEAKGAVRERLSVSKDDCLGRACDHYDNCFARKAREKLDRADILVSNYHLFFADLAAKASSGRGVLPAYDLAVLDEGHKAADIARDFFGERVTPFAVGRCVSLLDAKGKRADKLSVPKGIDPDLRELAIRQADALFDQLAELKRDEKRYKARLDRSGMFDPRELVASLRSAASQLDRAKSRGGVSPEGRLALEQAASRCAVVASVLERAANEAEDERWIYYLDEGSKRGSVALMAAPFSMADLLRANLFERAEDPVAAVVTSATLSTSSGDGAFDFIASELGCEAADELVVDSPFDYSRAALVVPRIDPPSNAKDSTWLDEMAAHLVDSVKMAGGRTLGLFTSYKALAAAHEVLVDAQREGDDQLDGIVVLKQGDAPRTQLLQRFREDERSVLLGCESFWEGVDVPGPACSLVFIDRIPFPHFLDPVADAHAARDKKSFFSYQVPVATLLFKQGVGRLIRSVEDRGVVVCADSRLVDKPYGKHFLRQLPAALQRNVYRTLGQARPYLEHLR